MISFISINYYLVKKVYIKPFKLGHFFNILIGLSFLKEINTVKKWSGPWSPLKVVWDICQYKCGMNYCNVEIKILSLVFKFHNIYIKIYIKIFLEKIEIF